MGIKDDYLNYPVTKGCNCLWCNQTVDKWSGNIPPFSTLSDRGRVLKDGEVWYRAGDMVGPPGCYLSRPLSGGLAAWLPDGDTAVGNLIGLQPPARTGFTKTGFSCNRCNEYNEYAASNQDNGSYVCFNCRT